MANHIKQPTVLDFFGLPGCGKSTVSHKLAESLRSDGYTVYEPSYNLDHNLSGIKRKLVKLWQYILYFLVHPVRSNEISKLVKDNGYSAFSERLSQCINIASKFWAVKKNGFDYILFDEGFCQASISLALKSENPTVAASNYTRIMDIGRNKLEIKPVYLQLDTETALLRLEKRGESNSRVDAEGDPAVRKLLMKRFEENCEALAGGDLLTIQSVEVNETVNGILIIL